MRQSIGAHSCPVHIHGGRVLDDDKYVSHPAAYINSSMTAVRTDAHFDKMIYPADVAEAAMLVIRTSFNCCPTQIWLQNNPDIIHKVCRACRRYPLIMYLQPQQKLVRAVSTLDVPTDMCPTFRIHCVVPCLDVAKFSDIENCSECRTKRGSRPVGSAIEDLAC